MNLVRENVSINVRFLFIILSSCLIPLPQILWSLLGYGGTFLIIIDSALVLAGFIFLLLSLQTNVNSHAIKFFQQLSGKFFKRFTEKLGRLNSLKDYIALLMVLYVLVPYGLSIEAGHVQIPLYLLGVLSIATAACIGWLIILNRKTRTGIQANPWHIPAAILIIGALWVFAFWYGTPKIPTDEFALDFYAAHLTVNGINPYISANTSQVFSVLFPLIRGVPANIATPYSTGGFVTAFTYPAFSMLPFIPAQIIPGFPSAIMIPFFAVLPVFIYVIYRRSNFKKYALLAAFVVLLNPSFLNQVSLGYPDVLWVIFSMASVYTYRRETTSGILMGLSAAVKQIPWLMIPFVAILIYRESGRKASVKWGFMVILIFSLATLPFIVTDPMSFLSSVMAPEFQQLIGIGFGPSQFAFLGIIPISRVFFISMVAALLSCFIVAYLFYYRELKFAFIAFPLLIFLFNYRLLLNYLLFWPIIALSVIPLVESRKEKNKGIQKVRHNFPASTIRYLVPLAIFIMLASPIVYQISGASNPPPLSLSSIEITGVSGHNVTSISVWAVVNSTAVPPNDLHFRFVPFSSSPTMNGYLWVTSNYSEYSNGTYLFKITPLDSSQVLNWNGTYRIVAYYGYNNGGKIFKIHSGILT